MRMSEPVRYELSFNAKVFEVRCPKGTPRSSNTLTANGSDFSLSMIRKITTAWSDYCTALDQVAGSPSNRPASITEHWHTASCRRASTSARYPRSGVDPLWYTPDS